MKIEDQDVYVEHLETNPGEPNSKSYYRLSIMFTDKDEAEHIGDLIKKLMRFGIIE